MDARFAQSQVTHEKTNKHMHEKPTYQTCAKQIKGLRYIDTVNVPLTVDVTRPIQ